MKGWGTCDDFQEQIEQTISDARSFVTARMQAKGTEECDDCGDEIPVARRLAYPSATRCVRCQTLREIGR